MLPLVTKLLITITLLFNGAAMARLEYRAVTVLDDPQPLWLQAGKHAMHLARFLRAPLAVLNCVTLLLWVVVLG